MYKKTYKKMKKLSEIHIIFKVSWFYITHISVVDM